MFMESKFHLDIRYFPLYLNRIIYTNLKICSSLERKSNVIMRIIRQIQLNSGLTVEWDNTKIGKSSKPVSVPKDVFKKACVNDADEGLKAALAIGFPVMIKASEGGGGKGIRKAENDADFPNLFRQVVKN